jgi:hypothetical protein
MTTSDNPAIAGIIPTDVLIPRLLLMQGQSDFVQERKAQQGDIVRSDTVEKRGDPDNTVEFIPLSQTPVWFIENKPPKGQRFEFRGKVPRTAMNARDQWQYSADSEGKEVPMGDPRAFGEWRRVQGVEVFALLPKDIDNFQAELDKAAKGETPDLSRALTPVVITFRSTGMSAGKAVVTHFTRAAQFRQKPYNFSLELACFLDSNDDGSFYVFELRGAAPKPIADKYKEAVTYWANLIESKGAELRVDSDESEATTANNTKY